MRISIPAWRIENEKVFARGERRWHSTHFRYTEIDPEAELTVWGFQEGEKILLYRGTVRLQGTTGL